MAYQSQIGFQRQSQLRILVCGKTGIGKSSLINLIAGEDVCEVGDAGAFAIEPHTKDVSGHTVHVNSVQVTIYDSPGLQGGSGNDEQYLDEMYVKCRDVDLVFFCHDMLIARWTDHEVDAVRMLTRKFGPTFWDKAILVLTKANALQPAKPMTKEETRDYFQRSTNNSARRFRNEVKTQLEAIHAETEGRRAEGIPVVPAGSDKIQRLPNGEYFIKHLWLNSSKRITDPYLSSKLKRAAHLEQLIPHKEEHSEYGESLTNGAGIQSGGNRSVPVAVLALCGAVVGAVVGTIASMPLTGTAIGLVLGAAVGLGYRQ